MFAEREAVQEIKATLIVCEIDLEFTRFRWKSWFEVKI